MNIFLLGNGFDLHYKLPTSYHNFLNTVDFLCKHKTDTISNIGEVFQPIAKSGKDRIICDSYNTYKNYYKNVTLPHEELSELIRIAENNAWFRYFIVQKAKGDGWIDFEKEIEKVLELMEIVFSVASDIGSVKPANQLSDIWLVLNSFKLGDFCNNLDIRPGDDKFAGRAHVYWPNAPQNENMFFFRENLHIRLSAPTLPELNIEAIVSELLDSLHEFSKLLSLYLDLFVQKPLKLFATKKAVQLDRVFSFPDTVISLNYTNTFETLYGKNGSAEIHHIHGMVGPEIVFGVSANESDELSRLNIRYQGFKKYFQRVVNETDNSYLRLVQTLHLQKEYQSDSYFCLFVFGHSLDETDKDIITELFGIADEIIIYYLNKRELANYVRRLTTIYGKKEFDSLRISKGLSFYKADLLNENWIQKRTIECGHAFHTTLNPLHLLQFTEQLSPLSSVNMLRSLYRIVNNQQRTDNRLNSPPEADED